MGLFSKSAAEKRKQQNEQQLTDMAKREKIIQKLQNRGLIYFDTPAKRLYIALNLAEIYLQSEKMWNGFLNNIWQWAVFNRQKKAWDDYFLNVELKAVREAKKKYAMLTPANIRSIRQKARMAVDVSAVHPPKVNDFEFFITDLSAPKVPIVAVGHYDGNRFEMENYNDVKRFLQKESEA